MFDGIIFMNHTAIKEGEGTEYNIYKSDKPKEKCPYQFQFDII